MLFTLNDQWITLYISYEFDIYSLYEKLKKKHLIFSLIIHFKYNIAMLSFHIDRAM